MAELSSLLTHDDHEEQFLDPPPTCPVELRGEGKPILVVGRPAAGLVGTAYRALEALCEAFPDGLTRQQLNALAGSKDARRALQYLEKVEPWKSAHVIVSDRDVGKRPTVYRIFSYRIIWGWMVRVPPHGDGQPCGIEDDG